MKAKTVLLPSRWLERARTLPVINTTGSVPPNNAGPAEAAKAPRG